MIGCAQGRQEKVSNSVNINVYSKQLRRREIYALHPPRDSITLSRLRLHKPALRVTYSAPGLIRNVCRDDVILIHLDRRSLITYETQILAVNPLKKGRDFDSAGKKLPLSPHAQKEDG